MASVLNGNYTLRKRLQNLTSTVAMVKATGDAITRRREEREASWQALGFEEPSLEQSKPNLAPNTALNPWPNE